MTIGERIRALRKERGLSLEELADRSGIALSVLSRIENDRGGATFRTHQRIAEAFGIPVEDLYRGLEDSEPETVLMPPESEEAETFLYDEKASALLLTSQGSRKLMLPQLIVLRPAGETALEQYRKGTERWIFCLEGQVEAKVGDLSYTLPQRGTLYFKASLPHQFMNYNAEGTAAKLISVMTPVVW